MRSSHTGQVKEPFHTLSIFERHHFRESDPQNDENIDRYLSFFRQTIIKRFVS